MLYQPTTQPHVILGVSIAVVQGKSWITASYNGQRLITVPAYGRIGDKLFINGASVALLSCGDIKRGEICV